MKTIIIYKSKYGSAKQYALWLAEALECSASQCSAAQCSASQCTVKKVEDIQQSDLMDSDVVIYVGSLYASSVLGFKQLEKHWDILQQKKLLLCMVGMTNPAEQEKYQQSFEFNVPEQYRENVKFFALRGNQLFSKMSFIHRVMMKVPKSMTEKIPVEQRSEDDKHFLEHFGEDIYYVKQENIQEIVEYVKNLNK